MLYQLTYEAIGTEAKLEYEIIIETSHRAAHPLEFALIQVPRGLYFAPALSTNFGKLEGL